MNKTLVITSLATCLISGNVLAADSGPYRSTANTTKAAVTAESPAAHKTFIKLDANKDGYIELNEAKANASLTRGFSTVAKSGKLSESEFSAWEVQHGATVSGSTK